MNRSQRRAQQQNANACIQCKDTGGDNDGPMYKWSSDGTCIYKSLRACQVANGPPVVASHDDFEKMYKDLPLRHRNRWDQSRFEQLVSERMYSGGGAVLNDRNALHEHGLPLLEKNEFGGIASETGVLIDSWTPTIIERGAFKNTLENPDDRNRVKVLFQHHHLIGVPTHMEEDETGLIVVGKVSQTILGIEVMQLMRDRALTEMSIGWDPIVSSLLEIGDDLERHIHELRLWEFSAVTFGANPGAQITVVNSLRGINDESDELLERLKHTLAGQCCGGCEDGTGCEGDEHSSATGAVLEQGVMTLVSTAMDRVRHGVSPAEREALGSMVSMLGRMLDVDAGIPTEESTQAGRAPVDLSMLDEFESLARTGL